MSILLNQVGVILQHILKIHYQNILYDNESQFVVYLEYQLVKEDLAFMITKTLSM